jgi:NitT/TauT family transport system permease protein
VSALSTRAESRRTQVSDLAILVLALLILWQLLHYVAGEVAMSAPLDTVGYTVRLVGSPDFWPHVLTTGASFVGALAIAMILGPIIGAVLGSHRLSGEVAEPILVSLYSIPKVILYPIILLLFGIGMAAEVAFGALHGIVPVMLFTMNAVRNIKPVFIKTARAMSLSSWTLMRTVLFPAALPEVFTGLRVGFSVTLLGTIMSEMFGSKRGLGYLLMNALGVNNVSLIMSLALLMVVFAAVSNSILISVENRLHRRR